MCYTPAMERIGIRELRNHASRVVRRARAGERIIITVDGVPAAQITPIEDGRSERSIDDLIAAGHVIARASTAPPRPAHPTRAPGPMTSTEILRSLRER